MGEKVVEGVEDMVMVEWYGGEDIENCVGCRMSEM